MPKGQELLSNSISGPTRRSCSGCQTHVRVVLGSGGNSCCWWLLGAGFWVFYAAEMTKTAFLTQRALNTRWLG